MTELDVLRAVVLAVPADDTARLVLADALQENGEVDLGRFVRAGVIAARSRVNSDDAAGRAARDEVAAVCATGAPAEWVATLGLGPPPPTPRDWTWEAAADRVTVRLGPAAGVFARGMLAEVRVSVGRLPGVGRRALSRWPVERFAAADVPGLAVWVEPPADDRRGWQLTAGFSVHPRRADPDKFERVYRVLDVLSFSRPDPGDLPPNPARRWVREHRFEDRPALVAGFDVAVARALAELRDAAGSLWPVGELNNRPHGHPPLVRLDTI